MDSVSLKFHLRESEALSPTTLFNKPLHSSSHTSFPIIAVAIIGILATGFLLVSYYIFVIKCCLNWHRIDILRRFSLSRRQIVEDPITIYSTAAENRGLDEALIRSIPIFQYKNSKGKDDNGKNFSPECAVCLNEFQEDEKLRSIPNCSHMFHIDCIDVWLQNNANCPLCRNSISISSIPLDRIMASPNSSSQTQNRNLHGENAFTGRDEDYVVIEIRERNHTNQSLVRTEEQSVSSLSPRKLRKKVKKLSHECIEIRKKDEEFCIQPIRRSFSMDSASDRQLYLSIQETVQQNSEGSSSSSNRIKRSFFSFGHGRGSRSSVLPLHMEI